MILKKAVSGVRLASRIVNKNGAPLHLIFFITNRCDFARQHCFLIASGELNDKSHLLLSIDEIDRIARSMPDLVALSLTGGEPFLRKDYSDIVKCFVRHSDLKSLSSVTNGVKADRILPHLELLLSETTLNIFITVSLDGSEGEHNQIRGKKNAFAQSIETIKQLKKLRDRFPQFAVGVNSTYIGSNFDSLMELYDVLEGVRPNYVTLNIMRGVDWNDRPQGLSTSEYRQLNARKNALLSRVEGRRTALQRVLRAKDAVMTELIAETYDQDRSLFPCYGGQLLGILKDDGEVYPCEQLSTSLGNVRHWNYDFMEVWNSEAAEKERQRIRARQCHCTYECSMSPNVLFNPSMYPRLAQTFVRQWFEGSAASLQH